ncbi:hypothetical protein SAMN05216326_13154 [Nitrosomonas marina]|uniref:Lipoprotein n=1 Tax=Nitrosomonas marina TaxID=917 RepID=A0A1I0EZ53_9PROT|nr:hypothetical protein [Nitrosomonas marina]SET50768.1 hypothetical protein SAMN05216326_13154 [Nitrosomonas marina]
MKRKLLGTCVMSFLLAGCMNAKHLVYVHTSTLGLEVAASVETTTGRMVFGYDRDTFALIPRKKENEDAMSLAAISCIYAQGINEVQFRHFVSTGNTAIDIAQDEKALEDIKKSIQGGSLSCLPGNAGSPSVNSNNDEKEG